MKLGAHVSIAGGIDKAVDRAKDLETNAFQIFAKNPRGWKGKTLKEEEVELFKTKVKDEMFEAVVVHVNYLINLATPKDELYQKSKDALKDDIKRADCLNADYLVLHPGNHTGSGIEAGINRINQALKEVIAEANPKVKLLLENVAGAGTEIGANIEELFKMRVGIQSGKVGVCLDTCHAFAAGYDLSEKEGLIKLLNEIDETFGIDNLEVIHTNDSKGELGNNTDRHYHIGQGKIGVDGFKRLVNHSNLHDKVFIIETPIDENGNDEFNLKQIENLVE
ncbi:deoxyribonuclease IV [Selenihalanaerobacter shriftii]|uniref:Probable endonuclease 4 n=1 Tax=Selenihalanaerobacter shriftii TaxID=142842 RepID=A0A1T4JNI1_9FIRM|nr:deoxyribonuclease IV [Selenihalanaerobacter shriftii]SJZ31723.1 Endonuclease IV [Selenihalanaerobacter shriftii]